MKSVLTFMGVGIVLLAFRGVVWAQPTPLSEPLIEQTFDVGKESWLGLGEKAKVSEEHAAENVKAGMGSLRFAYSVAPGQTNVLVAPLQMRSVDTLQSIHFWVKADHNTSLLFALREENGARYAATFFAPKDQWQRVEIATKDLVLQSGQDDPKDDDGKLDLDKVDGMALFDIDQVFVQGADPNGLARTLLGIQTGERTLYLDDMVLSSKPLLDDKATTKEAFVDEFQHPQAAWMSVGEIALKTVPDAETDDAVKFNALQADYEQKAGRVGIISKFVPVGTLGGKTTMSFHVACKRRTTLIVQVEETSGGKYNAQVEVPVYAAPDPVFDAQTLSFADFRRADDSKDDNDQLDLKQVKQITFIDATGLLGKGEGDNVLRISQLKVK